MKESVVVIQWDGSTEGLISAVNRFSKTNVDVHHIHILGIKEMQITPMRFFEVRVGERVWMVAAKNRVAALNLWKADQGWFGQLINYIRSGRQSPVVSENSESVKLSESGYKQKLALCDLVEYAN